jgi:hypothetical protein
MTAMRPLPKGNPSFQEEAGSLYHNLFSMSLYYRVNNPGATGLRFSIEKIVCILKSMKIKILGSRGEIEEKTSSSI